MKAKRVREHLLLFVFAGLLLAPTLCEAFPAEELIGQEPLLFTLPSTHDRTIDYVDDYYGKYHLVMTFFPAAFTPL